MATATFVVRIADMKEARALIWELRQLADEMRVAADPYAERLEHALDRFAAGPDEQGEDEA